MATGNAKDFGVYSRFLKIDGRHPYRDAVPDGYVDYAAYTRPGGEVFYFNFDLAKEMGLITKSHPHELNKELKEAILYTFSLQIINEYDIAHKTPIAEKDIRPYKYMATRYLQLQHPSTKGYTSGDGRSIWNGCFESKDGIWDVTSCGTGTTCLSPAVVLGNKLVKTGDPNVSYGSGRSDFIDGLCAAMMSEIMHKNGISTERTLAVISFADDTSINVRAGKNLLRPAHFFRYLKQDDYPRLKGMMDYFIERQIANGECERLSGDKRKYQDILKKFAISFAEAAACFEVEYIFCWMDWDGDNILTDGGIIDYGSVRQFGLYHHEYRYDDVDRMSTTITEQKNKAKYIVQNFAQITEYLISGKKENIKHYKDHEALKLFEETYLSKKHELILYRIGFNMNVVSKIQKDKEINNILMEFVEVYSYFEKVKSSKGLYNIKDGVTWDAVFCVRDILRELPAYYLSNNKDMSCQMFVDILKSNYATKDDLKPTISRNEKIRRFQRLYKALVARAAECDGVSEKSMLREIVKRSSLINRYERITGDSIIYASEALAKGSDSMAPKTRHKVFSEFVELQVLRPENKRRYLDSSEKFSNRNAKDVLNELLAIVRDCREGL
ncbi:MAG: YdiU family protein [Gammaproteobacteria bacterium]|nr:YdiU family protein [Gammaproteobacteria bacterium]